MNPQEKARFEARTLVMRDVTISLGARVLYWYLDDMANFRGTVYPRQLTIAKALGISLRQVQRFFGELEGRHIASRRVVGRATSRNLRWIAGFITPPMARRAAIYGIIHAPPAACDSSIEPVFFEPGVSADENQSQNPCWCEGSGYYPPGSGDPCRECAVGWSIAKAKARKRA